MQSCKLIEFKPGPLPCGRLKCTIIRIVDEALHKEAQRQLSKIKCLEAKERWLDNRRLLTELEVLTAEVRARVMRLEQAYQILDRRHAERFLTVVLPPKKERAPRVVNTQESEIDKLAKMISKMTPEQLQAALAQFKNRTKEDTHES